MKFSTVIATLSCSLFVLANAISHEELDTKAVLNSFSNNYLANDIIESNNKDKRGLGIGDVIPFLGGCKCDNYWYCQYCKPMNLVYESTCVPYCESNSGKGKKYKNMDACKKDFCGDHFECHKDCF